MIPLHYLAWLQHTASISTSKSARHISACRFFCRPIYAVQICWWRLRQCAGARQDNAAGLSGFSIVLLKSIFITAAANILMASSAIAEQVPQWEIGAGVVYIDFPDYRGSNERKKYV